MVGWCTGVGVYIDGGAGHRLLNLDTTGRSIGVEARNTSDLTIHNLTATAASDTGLLLHTVSLPLDLQNLNLGDNLTGLRIHTFSGPYTLDASALPNVRGSDTGIHLEANVDGLTLENLVLDGDTYGVNAYAATNSNLTFRNLDVSGRVGLGRGLYLQGAGHRVEGLVAHRRSNGIHARFVSDFSLHHVYAPGATASGIHLQDVTAPLSLRDLDLPYGLVGLTLTTFDAPTGYTIDAYDPVTDTGAITSLELSDTGISLSAVRNVTFRGFAANGVTYGIFADPTTNADLTFADLDLSGSRPGGEGLRLRGPGHTLSNLRADLRATGFYLLQASGATLSDLQASGCGNGLYFNNFTATDTPPVLSRIDLNDNTVGLRLAAFAPDAYEIGPDQLVDVSGSQTGYQFTTTSNVTVRDLAFDNPTTGVTASGSDLTFLRTDFSGPGRGTGLITSGPGFTLTDVTAEARATGFSLSAPSGATLTNLTARRNTTGLHIASLTSVHTAPVPSGITLTDNSSALSLASVNLSWTLNAATGLDTTGSRAGILVASSSGLTFDGLTLGNPLYGLRATTSNSNLTFTNLDVTGVGTGLTDSSYGLDLTGPGHELRHIIADQRGYGIVVRNAAGLVAENLAARRCLYDGLSLTNVTAAQTAPVLTGLDLRDNGTGLNLSGLHRPMTFDATTGLQVDGSATGVIVLSSSDLTFRGMTFNGNTSYGFRGYYNNTRLTLEDMTFQGTGTGWGGRFGHQSNTNAVYYAGAGHSLKDVQVNDFATAVDLVAADGVVVDGLTVRRAATAALRIEQPTPANPQIAPPTLTDLTLEDSAIGLSLIRLSGASGSPIVFNSHDPLGAPGVFRSLDRNDVAVDLSNSAWLVFEDLSPTPPAATTSAVGFNVNYTSNTIFRRLTLGHHGTGFSAIYGNSDLTLDTVDVSGSGDGTGIRLGLNSTSTALVYLGGDNHTLQDVTANRRSYGVISYGASNLTVDGFEARWNRTQGLRLEGYSWTPGFIPPTLAALDLRDNAVGLALHNFGGTAGAPFEVGPAIITAISGCDTSLQLSSMSHTRVHDLTLDGSAYGLNASGTALRFEGLDVSGKGFGTGLYMVATDPIVDGLIGDRRDYVLHLFSSANPDLRNVVASRSRTAGVYLQSTTTPIQLSNLTVENNVLGMRIATVTGADPLHIDSSALISHAYSPTALTITSAPTISVDDVGLGLSQSGSSWVTTTPPTPDPLCGSTVVADLTLTAPLDCRGHAGTALTIGADDITIDGGPNHYPILAPQVSTVISSTNRERLTIRRTDVSGAWLVGDGVVITGGSGHRIEDVVADARSRGASMTGTADLALTRFRAHGTSSAGLALYDTTLPLQLEALDLQYGLSSGLFFNGFDGADPIDDSPWTLGPGAIAGISQNLHSLNFNQNVRNVRVVGPHPVFDGTGTGIFADHITNANLSFEGVDVSASFSRGNGLSVRGASPNIDGLAANRRSYGLYIRDATDAIARNVTAHDALTHALRIDSTTVDALANLDLRRSAQCLGIFTVTPSGAPPLVVGPWDGATGAISALDGCNTDIQVSGSSGLRFEGLTLSGRAAGMQAAYIDNNDLEFVELDVSGVRRLGIGLQVSGTGHLLEGVVADGRVTGVSVNNASGIEIAGLRASNDTTALQLVGVATPLTLKDLSLTNSTTALLFNGFAPDPADAWTLGPFDGINGAITSVAGSDTSLTLSNTQHVTLRDLALRGSSAGVTATVATNAHLTFLDLDVSATRGSGTGLNLGGSNHRIERVVADHRTTGILATSVSGLALDAISVSGARTRAVNLTSVTGSIAMTHLRLNANRVGLYLSGIEGTETTPFIVDAHDPVAGTGAISELIGNDTDLEILTGRYITVRGLAFTGNAYGVLATHASNRDLTFEDVDVSAHDMGGTGIYFRGFNHTLRRLTASRRSSAVYSLLDGNTRYEDLVLRQNTSGLVLSNTPNQPATYLPPTFSNLDLRDNSRGLYLSAWALPITIDGAAGIDLARSDTGIYLHTNNANVTVRNFPALDNPTYGFHAPYATSGLTIEDVDASGLGLGQGIFIAGGPGAVLRDVVANSRGTGLELGVADGALVQRLTATRNGTGFYLRSTTAAHSPPTLTDLDLRQNGTALSIASIQAPLVLSASAGLQVAGSAYGLSVSGSAGLVFEDLDLRGTTTYGAYALTSVNDLVFRRINASGDGRGYGIRTSGAGHRFEDITAHDRENGLYAVSLDGGTVTGLEARGIGTAGFYLGAITAGRTAPTLSNLSLTDGNYGFQGANIQVPMTFNPSVFTDLTGNRTPIYFSSTTLGATVEDLNLPSPGTGLILDAWTSRDNIIRNVDVTGVCRGTGISVLGTDQLLEGVTAARRATGISVGNGDRVVVRDTVIGANTTGLTLASGSAIVNVTVVANASNTATRFRVSDQSYFRIGQQVAIDMAGGPFTREVSAVGSGFVTLTAALPSVPPEGTSVRGLDFGDPRLIVETSDICANGTGASLGNRIATMTSNYWRSSDGPRHTTLNPTGTGDLVVWTDANAALDPWQPVPTDKDNPYCNQAPVPDAGPDQEVCEGDEVTLDASASYDPDIEPLTFIWSQREGTAVSLADADQALATFTAPPPALGADNEVLTFRVRADDGHLWRTDDTEVLVLKGNTLPVADPGAAQTVDEGAAVSLDGNASFDPEAQPLAYLWEQVSGPVISIVGADTATPSFTAPLLDVGGGTISEEVVLSLTVTDVALPEHCGGPRSHAASVTVTVENVNTAPIADAGPPQDVVEAQLVILDGGASYDPDGDTLSFAWVQLSGAPVTLSGADTASPSFTSPTAPADGDEILVFEVTVFDGFGGTHTDRVTVTTFVDHCPDDPAKMEPGECGCGVAEDTGDDDGDSVINCLDGCPADPDKTGPDQCGCGVPDTDSDGDGAADCVDGCPADPLKTSPGLCGCGEVDDTTDSDGDGTADCVDGCPSDPLKTAPGDCGCGQADLDENGDGESDCLSDCTGLPDGTILAQDVPCGVDACGDITGTEYCENGTLITTCDEAYALVPDGICGADPPTVAYAIAFTPSGEAYGTIRCTRDVLGVIACDTEPDAPDTLFVHDGLFCPGYGGAP